MHKRAFLLAMMFWSLGIATTARSASEDGAMAVQKPGPLLERALAGPLKNVREIVFATRMIKGASHWYGNFGYNCDDENRYFFAGAGQGDKGRLCKLDIRTGAITVLLDAKGGSVRDPQIHYDAKKMIFSYRKADSIYYNLYEINVDGSGLRQITFGEFDDIEPTYLPDGDVIFVSTRCRRWVNCMTSQVAVLYRCSANGGNIRRLSANVEHDNTPWPMPDGRILYTRWEYIDRSQTKYHHLWTMNPDGTNQTVYYGNMHPELVMIDSKPIPGTNKVISSFCPGHGKLMHYGFANIVSNQTGPDDLTSAKPLKKPGLTVDPYPLSKGLFLAGRNEQLLLMDGNGNFEVIFAIKDSPEAVSEKIYLNEPRPIRARKREPVIPPRTDWSETNGRMIVADVYEGRRMEGVKRGDIKKLLVIETLPKPVNFSGRPDLLTWRGSFTMERVLGTVPVEEDGSAHFEVPANRAVFFVCLDENDLSVKRMQSFTSVLPGETTSCVGCHEDRCYSPAATLSKTPLAAQRPASKIAPFAGLPDIVDFHRDIQPIFDEHCISCHNYKEHDGDVLLTADLGPSYSHSYFTLFAKLQIADGRNGHGNQPPRSIGTSASRLMNKIDGSHYDVKVSPDQWRTVWLWIETGAAYVGTYAALRNYEQQAMGSGVGRFSDLKRPSAHQDVFASQRDVFERRCADCHDINDRESESSMALPFDPLFRGKKGKSRGQPQLGTERIILENDFYHRFSPNVLINLTRPQLSPLILGPLAKKAGGWESCPGVFKDKNDRDYRSLLSALKESKAYIDTIPRYSTPDFKPNRQYVREMKKYGILPKGFDPEKDEIDVFATDEKYWRSFNHVPKN